MASLRSLVETALTTALAGVDATVYAGQGYSDKVLPCLVCACVRAVQPFKNALGAGPANYLAQCEITLSDTASSTSTFDAIADEVHSITAADGFASGLSAGALTVFGETEPAQIEWSTEGDSWVQKITLTMECSVTSTA